MTPLRATLQSLSSCLQATHDVLAELIDGNDARLIVLRQELARARELLDEASDDDLEPQTSGRPTLKQALAMAEQVGVSEEDADRWWHARSAVDWMRGTAGGGSLPIGTNHAADLKSFTNTSKSIEARSGKPYVNGHAQPKQDTVWSLRQSLDAVNAEIEEIESYRATGAWGELPVSKRREKDKLLERKSELRKKIASLGS